MDKEKENLDAFQFFLNVEPHTIASYSVEAPILRTMPLMFYPTNVRVKHTLNNSGYP